MSDFNTPVTKESTDSWITPREVLELLGHFDLDPCAAMRQPWATADRMLTERENGLLLPWSGRVWCNPPYGKGAEAFMRRMAEHTGGGYSADFHALRYALVSGGGVGDGAGAVSVARAYSVLPRGWHAGAGAERGVLSRGVGCPRVGVAVAA